MKYTAATVAKALVAFGVTTISAATAAAHGTDLSTLDFGAWVAALGGGLVAFGGVFTIPNKDVNPPMAPADQAVASIQETVNQAIAGQAGLQQIQDTVGGLVNIFPGGNAVEQAIKSLRFPGI